MARSCKVGKKYLRKTRYDELLFQEFQLFRKYYIPPMVLKVTTLNTLKDVLQGGNFFPSESYDLPDSLSLSIYLGEKALDGLADPMY